ncbi:hypothetical protein AB835_13735 [Candidatus Endobugula sertula]|uniref:AB hydrolase-1 domain-containing protein n=1 Tax=Candidatus Endobugula sertula TaxID=62101 RepID=A0A1D2QLR3_9GAMM|nr:hypothetical protein AB835_13735 [Candidatus Endobugula sertula]
MFMLLRMTKYILLVMILLLIMGLFYQLLITKIYQESLDMPGKLVTVGEVDMHIHCTGSGSPTVVLISGLGDSWAVWDDVQKGISTFTKVCSYDRNGIGFSEYSNVIRDADAVSDRLYTLLKNTGLDGPYILVGHSLGGIYSRAFTYKYGDKVSALVLIESAHEDQVSYTPPHVKQYLGKRQDILKQCIVAGLFGLNRMLEYETRSYVAKNFRDNIQKLNGSAYYCKAKLAEFMSFEESAEMMKLVSKKTNILKDIPISILYSASDTKVLESESARKSRAIVRAGYIAVANTSNFSRVFEVPSPGHYIHIDKPNVVVNEVITTIGADSELTKNKIYVNDDRFDTVYKDFCGTGVLP